MSLKKWFGENWVDISTTKDGKHLSVVGARVMVEAIPSVFLQAKLPA